MLAMTDCAVDKGVGRFRERQLYLSRVENATKSIGQGNKERVSGIYVHGFLIDISATLSQIPPSSFAHRFSYLDVVLREMERWNAENHRMKCGLIVSINRTETAEQAMESVRLAMEMRERGIVGFDLSGNPSIGSFETWRPALELAKKSEFKVTLHIGEVINDREIKVRKEDAVFDVIHSFTSVALFESGNDRFPTRPYWTCRFCGTMNFSSVMLKKRCLFVLVSFAEWQESG
jgi:hypothetical protein